MKRTRVRLDVWIDLDPIPGAFHTKENAAHHVRNMLTNAVSHYHPLVSITNDARTVDRSWPEKVLAEHEFMPGDGENTHVRTCQFPGCGADLNDHEEAEPCCIAYVTSGKRDHSPECHTQEPVRG